VRIILTYIVSTHNNYPKIEGIRC